MISVILLIFVVIGAYLVVLAGATAYELTGLDRQTARFQALSAFTGTGFTTRVTELVVSHPLRRRITSILIILGYAGTATVVASLVTSVDQSFQGAMINIIAMAVFASVAWIVLQRWGTKLFGDSIRRFLAPRITGQRVPHEELKLYKRGFGITRIEVPRHSRVIGKQLRELDLRSMNVQILAVEKAQEVHPIPEPGWVFEPHQHVIVYGDLQAVQGAFGPD